MKLQNILTVTLALIAANTTNSFGQSAKSLAKEADYAFMDGDYYTAARYYKRALAMDSSKLDIVYSYAEANRLCNNYRTAEKYYKFVFDRDKGMPQLFPQTHFWLAVSKKEQGKYTDAKKFFKQYSGKHKNDNDYYSKRAKHEMAACDFAINLAKQVNENVNVIHLDETVNSQYADSGPFIVGDTLIYFTSTQVIAPETPASVETKPKKKGKKNYDEEEDSAPPVQISKLYKVIHRDSTYSGKKELSPFYNLPGVDNSSCTFSPDKKRFFFVRSVKNVEGRKYNEIYMSELRGGKWLQPTRMGEQVNLSGYTNTNPTAGFNGSKGYILYFSSDRPGGQGRMDIWSVTMTADNKISPAVNLGAVINTMDDEVTPYFDQTTQTIYFSSGWHKGLGGLDIFKSEKKGNDWSEPVNMGFPINTNSNDSYFTISESGREAYFASNRTGSYAPTGLNCCNDIYYVEYKDVKRRVDSLRKIVALSKVALEKLKKTPPITLYFDNDAPEPHSEDTISALDYETTYHDFIDSKKDYEAEFSKSLTGANKGNAIKDINEFFTNYVERGFNDLENFSKLMAQALGSGKRIIITMKAFCSPLAMDDYNINLAKRRLATLKNYFNEYDHSALQKYMNGSAENGGKLDFILEAIGESQAPKTISDNPNDVRNSVYSRVSALERKIQITEVQVLESQKKKN